MPPDTEVAGLKPVHSANSCTSANVAGTSPGCIGMKFFCGLAPDRGLDRVDELHQLHRLVIADVEHPVRCLGTGRVWLRRIEVGIRRRRAVEYPYHALCDVVDVGEVADHLAVVEDVDAAGPREWPW